MSIVRVGRLGLMVDFDGTIAPIAPTPDEAAVSPQALDSLRTLVEGIEMVSVVSGRDARDLEAKVRLDGATYVGNHGAEYIDGGELHVEPGVAEYRDRVDGVLRYLRSEVSVPGIVWQDKNLGASVHYRLTDDPERVRELLDAALRRAPGSEELDTFWGKMVLELVAPLGLDKGHAVRKLVAERRLDGAIFLGDDTTDATALRALGELREDGVLQGAAIAVLHDDSPEELVRVADYTLAGVEGVESFFEWLARTVRRPRLA